MLPALPNLKAIFFCFDYSEVNSTLLITSELAKIVQELVYSRGHFWKKANQWPRGVDWTTKNLRNAYNFLKRLEGIN